MLGEILVEGEMLAEGEIEELTLTEGDILSIQVNNKHYKHLKCTTGILVTWDINKNKPIRINNGNV